MTDKHRRGWIELPEGTVDARMIVAVRGWDCGTTIDYAGNLNDLFIRAGSCTGLFTKVKYKEVRVLIAKALAEIKEDEKVKKDDR